MIDLSSTTNGAPAPPPPKGTYLPLTPAPAPDLGLLLQVIEGDHNSIDDYSDAILLLLDGRP